MLILGIDTATKVCSVALTLDGRVLAEQNSTDGIAHSRRLLPEIDMLLKTAKVAKADLDMVAVSMGPGSFTGLRIGLATAEAIAYAQKKFLHGVDTLQALAFNLQNEDRIISPLIDAQKGNFYQALYQWQDGKLVCLAPTAIVNEEQAWERIGDRPCVVTGECAKITALPNNAAMAEEGVRMPLAKSLCAIGEREFDKERDKIIFGLEPYYIRRSEAEELWEQRHR